MRKGIAHRIKFMSCAFFWLLKFMNKQNVTGTVEEKRLLNIKEVCTYIGVGQTQARRYMDDIGAVRRFGRRVLFDKHVIDSAITNM